MDARDRRSDSRSAHRALVHAAIRAGHPQAPAFAEAWAQADPDHGPALQALADMLAARGDRAALRAYASAVEVRPFSRSLHARLAKALESKGDLARACSHRRAIVSIDPSRGSHHADLATCLARAGEVELARDAVLDAEGRIRTERSALRKVSDVILRGTAPVVPEQRLHGSPDVRATLTWSGDVDLDVALVDARGRRLSVVRPDGVRVRERPGSETLTLRKLRSSVYVEITRAASKDPSPSPISASLRVRTPDGSRTFPVTIAGETLRIARVARIR